VKNKDFDRFEELKGEYHKNPTDEKKLQVIEEVCRLINEGWITKSMKVIYDLGMEKYRTIGLESLKYKTYDKDKTIRIMLKKTYGKFLPKSPLEYVDSKEMIFDPHQPLKFTLDGVEYGNLFARNKFLSYKPQGRRIDTIEWDKYKTIKPLFENVFDTLDRVNFFTNWLAYCFQTLQKARMAIISKGIQGTGKGVIFEHIIQYAIGERFTTILENEALRSRFNGELENKLFVLANEIKADFREGNSIYERLKMYVTDKEIRFEDKNIKARTIPNFFNIWFHSNNDVPLQIQGSDRRYTVFNTRSIKLTEVSEALGYEHISDFIEQIDKERDRFIIDIMSLKYDMHMATTPMNTEEKELIYEASITKIEILSDKLKKYDVAYFRDILEDYYEELSNGKEDMLNIRATFSTSKDFEIELKKQMYGNYITNQVATFLYRIIVNDKDTVTKIGSQLNKHLQKAKYKKINGKAFKYRAINRDKEVIFEEQTVPIIEEVRQPSTTTKNHLQDIPSDF
jgi:hypothetical protein